jgi:sulfur-oxidizing protein SoxB
MVRVGGIQYTCDPKATVGHRIHNLTLKGKPLEADKTYKVAGWASVQEGVQGTPIWDVVAGYLKDQKVVRQVRINQPKLTGMAGNPGIAP